MFEGLISLRHCPSWHIFVSFPLTHLSWEQFSLIVFSSSRWASVSLWSFSFSRRSLELSASRSVIQLVTFSLVIFPQVKIKNNMKKEHHDFGEGHKLEIDSSPGLNLLRRFPKHHIWYQMCGEFLLKFVIPGFLCLTVSPSAFLVLSPASALG